jgi:2-polyprenyl-6-methoxyphenol hydroxylase-like FAD-dependent oxidoreductase
VARARAVVIGAGIGGLAAAAGLRSAGWDVTACERAAALEPVGAGLSLGPNGLRALDVVGAGDALRAMRICRRWCPIAVPCTSTGRMVPGTQ